MLDVTNVCDRDVYDCPAGAFMVIGKAAATLHIVWLVDGAERHVTASSLFNCVLRERAA